MLDESHTGVPIKVIRDTVVYGVIAVKDERAWGLLFSDGQATCYGWLNVDDPCVSIGDSKYIKSPQDFADRRSGDAVLLRDAALIDVKLRTILETS